MRKLLLLLLLLCPLTVMAQGGGQQGGYPAYRFRRLAADPATCTTGDVYFNYVTPAYRKCQTTNTWTDFAFSGGAFTSPALGPDGTAALPTYSFSSDPNTGIFRSGADALGFSTGGTERWVINASGALNPFVDNTYDIGNGTVNPRDVNVSRKLVLGKAATNTGQIDFAGTTSGVVSVKPADAAGTWTLTLPANDGDSGQALTTNGSGVASWTTIAATPGGSDTQIQFNDGGAFGGDAGLTYNKTTDALTAAGQITSGVGALAAPGIAVGGNSNGIYSAFGYTRLVGAGLQSLAVGDNGSGGPAVLVYGTVEPSTDNTIDLGNGPVLSSRFRSGYFRSNVVAAGYISAGRNVSAKTTDYTVTAADLNTFFTNTGAGAGVVFTLPTPVVGMTYEFYRDANQTVTIDVTAGITIRVGASASTSGGNVTLDAVGSRIRIVAISTTQWVGDLSGTATFN